MALFDISNIIGSTSYFVFALLLVWVSRIPRTNSGAGYWACAMFCAFCGRMLLVLMPPVLHSTLTEALYSGCTLLEKTFLLLGAFAFFNQPQYKRPYLVFIALGFAWVISYWLGSFNASLYGAGLSLFNSGSLFLFAFITYRERHQLPQSRMLVTALIAMLLGLHWGSFPVLRITPEWLVPGFFIGTSLMMLLYLSLIAAVLQQFQQRLEDAEHHALDLAYHDPLTGLNNQRYMNALFEQALRLATRPHQVLAVIYIDLDNFKPINDGAGHQMGDEVLKTIAQRLLAHTRSTDICARLGGDEFVVIATQLESEQQAQLIADKILQQCCQPVRVNHIDYHLGASIGISICPNHGNDLEQLLKTADQAMYGVKKNGKSGYQLFHSASL